YDLQTKTTTQHPNKKIHHLYVINWSADKNWFVSTVHGGMGFGHAILALQADSDRVVDLKIGGCRPCLSSDGKKITWSRDDHTICVDDLNLSSSAPPVSNVKVIAHRKKAHLYHPDFSPDGKYITYSVGPGGRVRASGPGTHTQVAEMVGVRGKWNVFLKPVSGEGPRVQLTSNEDLSNKESEWIPRPVVSERQ
ncbi:MAG: PD40 domain-containing protein, partial [Planctomycetes bacterium]|nr:PD40 domain-containing protein [Planctomycetota bacterium]